MKESELDDSSIAQILNTNCQPVCKTEAVAICFSQSNYRNCILQTAQWVN